ncbi:hypothetical protein [Chromatium okenii]|uniref:hypothetical protein n=1 Tax=Chromatium okenii TaxID=61644 RepID=UPI0011B037FF|nr:hypothetical protein [Chromatium okenii]
MSSINYANGENTGQSLCLLRVAANLRPLTKAQLPNAGSGHQYLLGQGLYSFRDGYLREALPPGEIKVSLRFHPNTIYSERHSVAEALLIHKKASLCRKGG